MDSAKAYEQSALSFVKGREQSNIGFQVVRQWADQLKPQSEVLEIACGGGYPVTQQLNEAGLTLWAIDSSETLLSIFKERYPDIPTRCERVQDSHFFNRKFDAVIAIGLIFLLPEYQQKQFIKKVSKILQPKGRFLFTAPTETGKWNDLNTGIECHSLGLEQYTKILNSSGFYINTKVLDEGKNNHYDTRLY